jgi:hypothetical protein
VKAEDRRGSRFASAIDMGKIKAICEKYWPVVKEAKDTK